MQPPRSGNWSDAPDEPPARARAHLADDPDWARAISEWREPAKSRHLPAHEDCSLLDPDAAAAHLRTGGTLGAMPGYEERPGQQAMLKSVVRAFDGREHLMIEAGTGVGKSLAYLVPAILWAHANDTPVVISTATRNLQSQLMTSDIPRALAVLGEDAAKFKVALLKGRQNYVCLRAVDEFLAPGYWTMSAEEQAAMPEFEKWILSTKDGDLDGYDGLPRAQLTLPGEECSGRKCPFYSRCFVYRARKNAADAHLLVVNHALTLAQATSPGGDLLPPYGRLVLDEAHNLEDIATEYLSREFSLVEFSRLLNRLRRTGRGKRARPGGVLAAIDRQLAKGAFEADGLSATIGRLLADAASAIVSAVNAAEDLADIAETLLDACAGGRRTTGDAGGRCTTGDAGGRCTTGDAGGRRTTGDAGGRRDIVRYRTVEGVRSYSLHGLFEPYPATWNEAAQLSAQNDFEEALARLVNLLHALRDALDGQDFSQQLEGIAAELVQFANDTDFVFKGEAATHAFWAERMHPPKRPSYVRLVGAPLSVADELHEMVYEPKDSVILASATLRVGNDFKFMAKRLGCRNRFSFQTAESPFDYFRQALVLAPDYLPDPSAGTAQVATALADALLPVFRATKGRGLVLFTSYELMNATAAAAHTAFAEGGLRLLVQGEGLSRESMVRILKESVNLRSPPPPTLSTSPTPTILFGAQSFWEGVDVAGEALSCVVIARLPFAQVGDPIVEARTEAITRAGGNAFRDYTLPEAVIRFRQGFGRLIRTKRDRGVVIITDPRLVTKSYGAVFRKSIPATVHTVTDPADLLARLETLGSRSGDARRPLDLV